MGNNNTLVSNLVGDNNTLVSNLVGDAKTSLEIYMYEFHYMKA